jgi:hypothetical protein
MKASVPKRFGLSRFFRYPLSQNHAKLSDGFLIPQIAPRSPQAQAASVARFSSPFQEASLATLTTYNTGRFRSLVPQAPRPLRRSS